MTDFTEETYQETIFFAILESFTLEELIRMRDNMNVDLSDYANIEIIKRAL